MAFAMGWDILWPLTYRRPGNVAHDEPTRPGYHAKPLNLSIDILVVRDMRPNGRHDAALSNIAP
jgi:hypothetical protein